MLTTLITEQGKRAHRLSPNVPVTIISRVFAEAASVAPQAPVGAETP